MATVRGICPDCNGLKVLFHPDGEVAFETCPKCKGTGEVDYELVEGLKVTLLSGPDKYPFVVCSVQSPTHLWLLPGSELPTDHKLRFPRQITLRRDGVWRERGHSKSAGSRYVFGIAESHRSREA